MKYWYLVPPTVSNDNLIWQSDAAFYFRKGKLYDNWIQSMNPTIKIQDGIEVWCCPKTAASRVPTLEHNLPKKIVPFLRIIGATDKTQCWIEDVLFIPNPLIEYFYGIPNTEIWPAYTNEASNEFGCLYAFWQCRFGK